MDVKQNMTQSQLLQRSAQQLGDVTTVQENLRELKKKPLKEDTNYDLYPSPKEESKEMVDGLNEILENKETSLRFQFHDKLEEYYVTIIDSDTEEVVKEIPPKKMLDYHAAMAEFLGLLVDDKG
ncbi:flagellar protein FlaG [Halobacillus sp. Marseille-P3879]|uniref:flagellar protein FlaG n=1 Tax=Halobacillus sp. Marseille-P3879 TaxID=2045014 RepID=UPI001F2415C7|nr:flagellar protein FlaG [Halobacillus sp. Marseille-P3879]